MSRHLVISNWHWCYSACLTLCGGACVGCHSPPVVFQYRLQKLVSQVAFQCGTVSTKFFQWCSSVPCKYSLGGPVVFQCTLGQPVAFQWHSSVHWTSQCTLAQGKGRYKYTCWRVWNPGKVYWILYEVVIHDDVVIKWKHFLRCWPFVRGIHRSPVNSPHKNQWRGVLICTWIND